MNGASKFEIRFDPSAYREYQKLDGSIVTIVDKKLAELEFRADVIGKLLINKPNSQLAGCREIKLRDAGIRIVYKITGEKVDILRIVYILTIEKRADEYVFKLADQRLADLERFTSSSLSKHLKKAPVYRRKK
jgi:mRNA interferase RelE/StbE